MKKKLFILLFVVCMTFMLAGTASAVDCYAYGTIQYLKNFPTYADVYISNAGGLPSYWDWFRVTDADLISAANSAMSGDKKLRVRGTGLNGCPTTGTYRYLGVANFIGVYLNY